jgi:hypothetical protein
LSEFVTDAGVEWFHCGGWERYEKWERPIPEAVDRARFVVAAERHREVFPDEPRACPVRVVDSAGTVVQQWGQP